MARIQYLALAFSACLAGCGSTISQLDEFPDGPDVSASAWPRLVDTPQPPEQRLTSGEGERALERLTSQRAAQASRRVRADAVAPVSETLLARGDTVRSRASQAAPSFDEADLLARAERLRAKTASAPVQSFAAPSRPTPLRPLDAPVVSASFEERARRAKERAARAGT